MLPEDQTRKEKLLAQIKKDERFDATIIRRKKSKSGNPRYYIYNDEEQLQIASEMFSTFQHFDYNISLESNNFDESNPLTFAKLSLPRYDRIYSAYLFGKEQPVSLFTIKYLLYYEKKSSDRQLLFSFDENYKHGEIFQSPCFLESYRDFFPDIAPQVHKSQKNLLLTMNGKHAFSVAKIYNNEYRMSVSYPLSILDGFLIALSTFKRCLKE